MKEFQELTKGSYGWICHKINMDEDFDLASRDKYFEGVLASKYDDPLEFKKQYVMSWAK